MNQVAVHPPDDNLCRLRLRGKRVAKPHLYILTEAEATGYGKDHSEDGHDGQQRAVGQGCGLGEHTLGGEEADG